MQDVASKLTVLHDDNGVFTDHSNDAHDYSRDSFSLELNAAEDRLLIGFKKPINALYLELSTPNAAAVTITGRYNDGTSFLPLIEATDDTKGLTRSGFYRWKRNQTLEDGADKSDEVAVTIDGKELFWYELKVDTDLDVGFTVQGLNMVFADDRDLLGVVPSIMSYLDDGETNFIKRHQAVRNKIIQKFRNKARLKVNSSQGLLDLNQWDFLDHFQLREAAKFFALSDIYFDAFDEQDSNEFQRYLSYKTYAEDAFDLFYVSLDNNDDGVSKTDERMQNRSIGIVRQ
jgi:hypothetical protein